MASTTVAHLAKLGDLVETEGCRARSSRPAGSSGQPSVAWRPSSGHNVNDEGPGPVQQDTAPA